MKEQIKAKNIKTYPLGEALASSENMRPYIALLVAQLKRQDTAALEAVIKNLPYEKRYVHRLIVLAQREMEKRRSPLV